MNCMLNIKNFVVGRNMVYNKIANQMERGIYVLRFYYVILISIPFIVFYLLVADYYVKNRERYDEEQCYELAQKVVVRFKKNARIKTVSYGEEHLPQEGGYIMYSNHQGRKISGNDNSAD